MNERTNMINKEHGLLVDFLIYIIAFQCQHDNVTARIAVMCMDCKCKKSYKEEEMDLNEQEMNGHSRPLTKGELMCDICLLHVKPSGNPLPCPLLLLPFLYCFITIIAVAVAVVVVKQLCAEMWGLSINVALSLPSPKHAATAR